MATNDHGHTDQRVWMEYQNRGTIKGTAKALGIPPTTLKRRIERIERGDIVRTKDAVEPQVVSEKKPSDGLTLDKILKQHHPVEKFVSVIETMPRGEFHTDIDMQRLCEIGKEAWQRLKRNDRVQDYKVRLPDSSIVWGSKQDAALLRRKLMEA